MADQVAEFTAYILAQYPISAPALIRAMELKDERIAALEAQVVTPSPPVAAPPATPVAPEPYGQVTTHAKTGQQFFYRWPEPPYLDNVSECVNVYLKESSDAPNPRSNDQGNAKDGRSDTGATGAARGAGADQHHQHRSRQADADGTQLERDCGGDGVHGACDVSQEVKAAAQPQPQPAQPLTDEQCVELYSEWDFGLMDDEAYAVIRAVEKAHGITAPSTPTPPEVAP